MATSYILTDSAGPGVRWTLVNTDDLVVGASATVISTDLAAIEARGWDNHVSVRGAVIGNTEGIFVRAAPNGAANQQSFVRVHEGGTVHGNLAGVRLDGANHGVFNAGEISGVKVGLVASHSGRLVLTNEGLVSGRTAIEVEGGTAVPNVAELTNRGTILGTEVAYVGSEGVDRFVNRGEVQGDVLLDWGDDRFDNRGGRVDGSVDGGDGADVFLPGAHEDVFFGGAGLDTLDLRSSAGGRVSLLDDTGSGWSTGDTYAGIERVWGSRVGADTIVGSTSGDTLMGMGGDDRLLGGLGRDELVGGEGLDRLTGGSNNDRFLFHHPDHAGDVITDFRNTTGNDDSIWLGSTSFGGGLLSDRQALAASRFQSRADNVAQDADDRAVFRTTDATLWWDADGKGGTGPVLVADLQDGAILTAGDIFLF